MTYKLCPCCGQDIVIPNDLLTINTTPTVRGFLFKLYRASPNVVPYEAFGKYKRVSIHVLVARAREAIKDVGAPYQINTMPAEGLSLTQTRGE
jgi:hypothetical protein